MKTFTKFAAMAVGALALAAAAAPSQATTVIGFSSSLTNPNFSWTNNGVSGVGAGGTLTGSGNAFFTFLSSPQFPALSNVLTTFSFSATTTSGPAVNTASLGLWAQPGLNGTFSYIYSGPTTSFGGITVATGANLLSGTFSNAWIQGAGGSGSTNIALANGGVVNFTSDFDSFGTNSEFAFNLLGVNPGFGASGGRGLNNFTAYGNGTFSVPEPGTWALMIMGFGGVGAMLRNRRREGAAIA